MKSIPLSETPYRTSFPLEDHPLFHLLICIAYGVETGIAGSLLFDEAFGALTWNIIDQFVESDAAMSFSTQERYLIYGFFWSVLHPWWGLLWGTAVGAVFTGLNTRTWRATPDELDTAAERMIRKPGDLRTAIRWIPWKALASAHVQLAIAWAGSWSLGISVLTTTCGLFAASMMQYPMRKKVHGLAKAKYEAARANGLIPAEEFGADWVQKAKSRVAAAFFIGYIVCVPIVLLYVWPDVKDAGTFVAELSGRFLSEADAASLEQTLPRHPDDFAAHVQLFSYYGYSSRFPQKDLKRFYERMWLYGTHLLWLIDHSPQFIEGRLPELGPGESLESLEAWWRERVAVSPEEMMTRPMPLMGNCKRTSAKRGVRSELCKSVARRLCDLGPPWERRLASACR
ncbi:MAG: hypothetical protein IT365_17100 [Candidatus Hydrogenedentes bacterium]|nr:hypothetical protein [Candidatus Hydrogenedentota bacterium]